MRAGIVGSTVAVAGSAAFAAFASAAGASSSYHSTATGAVGAISVAGNAQNLAAVTATTGDSPKNASIGSAAITSALQSVPGLGTTLASAFGQSNPGSTNLATESATASAGGTSTACAAMLAASCTTRPMSLILQLPVSQLSSDLGSLPGLGSVIKQLPDPLSAYKIVLTLNGPRASCSAGPAGSGATSATDNPAGATADLQNNGKSVLPNGPIGLSGGELFAQLLGAANGSPLAPVLKGLANASPLEVTVDPNSRKYTSGSQASAVAGGLTLSAATRSILSVGAATANCGPNTVAASSAPAPAAASPAPAAPAGTSTATSAELPLSGIQTDEGRWVPSANGSRR